MSAQPSTTAPSPMASKRRRGRSADPNSPLHPRMVLARLREHDSVRLRAQGHPWAEIAEYLGIAPSSAVEACKRGLRRLALSTAEEVEMLVIQVEQVISDVRTGELDKQKADVVLRGLGMLATLKGVGRKESPGPVPAHVLGDAERRVADVEEYRRRVGSLRPPDPPPSAA